MIAELWQTVGLFAQITTVMLSAMLALVMLVQIILAAIKEIRIHDAR